MGGLTSLPPCGGGSGWGVQDSCTDAFQNSVRFLENIRIPEPEHSEALRDEPPCAPLVLFDCPGVLASVDLDHQPSLEAGEINDVGTHRNLTTETVAFDLRPTESPPQQGFGIGHVRPELPSSLDLRACGGVY